LVKLEEKIEAMRELIVEESKPRPAIHVDESASEAISS